MCVAFSIRRKSLHRHPYRYVAPAFRVFCGFQKKALGQKRLNSIASNPLILRINIFHGAKMLRSNQTLITLLAATVLSGCMHTHVFETTCTHSHSIANELVHTSTPQAPGHCVLGAAQNSNTLQRNVPLALGAAVLLGIAVSTRVGSSSTSSTANGG